MAIKKGNSEIGVKLHDAAVKFLYPAILGSTIYGVIDYANSVQNGVYSWQFYLGLFLALSILVMYYFDMVFTDKENHRNTYTTPQFCIEILIILTIYPAVQSAVGNSKFLQFNLLSAATYLALAKLFAALWELCSKRKNEVALIVFSSFFLIYSVLAIAINCGCLSWIAGVVLTLSTIIIDCCVFIFYGEAISDSSNKTDKTNGN